MNSNGNARSRDDRLVASLSKSLFENLMAHYHPCDEDQVEAVFIRDGGIDVSSSSSSSSSHLVKVWLKEMLIHARRLRRDGDEEESNQRKEEEEIVRKAMLEAVRRWKNECRSGGRREGAAASGGSGSKKKKQGGVGGQQKSISFSIFDQLAGGGGGGFSLLDSIVTWDKIEAAGSPEEKLKLLQKVQHVDDVAPDWNCVSRLLSEGLIVSRSSGSGNDDPAAAYLELHEKWFEQTRSRPEEYQYIQIDLCRNVVSALDFELARPKKEQPKVENRVEPSSWMIRLCGAFRKMWLDWMLRGLFVDNDQVRAIGATLWRWMTSKEEAAVGDAALAAGRAPPSFFPSRLGMALAKVDPRARCFSSWLAHLQPDHVLDMLLVVAPEQQLLPPPHPITPSIAASIGIGNSCIGTNPLPLLISFCKERMLLMGDDETATVRYILAAVAAILDNLRVALFPFDALLAGADGEIASTRAEAAVVLFDLYVWLLSLHTSNSKMGVGDVYVDSITASIAADAIETLLSGFRRGGGDNAKLFSILKTKLEISGIAQRSPSTVDAILDRLS